MKLELEVIPPYLDVYDEYIESTINLTELTVKMGNLMFFIFKHDTFKNRFYLLFNRKLKKTS